MPPLAYRKPIVITDARRQCFPAPGIEVHDAVILDEHERTIEVVLKGSPQAWIAFGVPAEDIERAKRGSLVGKDKIIRRYAECVEIVLQCGPQKRGRLWRALWPGDLKPILPNRWPDEDLAPRGAFDFPDEREYWSA